MRDYFTIQFRRGSTDACAKYAGQSGELILDLGLYRVRLYSGKGTENRLLDKGELASIYMDNHNRFFEDTKTQRFLAFGPGLPICLTRASSPESMASYIGAEGEIIFVEGDGSLRCCDGHTPGGILL